MPRVAAAGVRLIAPAEATTFLVVAATDDCEGTRELRLARIRAHSHHLAANKMRDELYADYGLTAEAAQEAWDNGDEPLMMIVGLEVYTDVELGELDILTARAVQRRE